jgi:haloalkane dehalogenase
MTKKVLFTSVCRPLGPKHGDAPSVGYELLFGQVTRAQSFFSPRATHLHFSLEYVANNIEAPAVVLQYPSKRELIRELKKGYDYVGISFLLAVFHKMKDVVALVRRHSPSSKIILGGYGTVLPDEVLAPHADYICREEGVGFMRRLLEEPALPMPYKHPMIVSTLKIFSVPVSKTGMIFAGLGCPHGCDFCCTSNFFAKKHIRLLPEGKDIYNVIERYLDLDPTMAFTILDEDFLLNKKRAMDFRECVQKGGRAVSVFVFSSIKAISKYTVQEILEMGIDGFWIGYEGTRSGYAKQQGRPVEEILREFREHGITILTSMIVGFDYQTKDVVAHELEGLLALKPSLSQFLIYGPTPGTPFYDRIMRDGLMRDDLRESPETFYRKADGFAAMVKHPTLSPAEIEEMQRWCFEEDFKRLGPSVYRVIETWLLGYLKNKDSGNPIVRAKARMFANDVRKAYPIFHAGVLLGPTPEVRRWIAELRDRAYEALGPPTFKERMIAVGAVGAAIWTKATLALGFAQHPSLNRTSYRMPRFEFDHAAAWHAVEEEARARGMSLALEFQHAQKQVWLRWEGAISALQAERLAAKLAHALEGGRQRLVIDFKKLSAVEAGALEAWSEAMKKYRSQIRLALPKLASMHPELLLIARMFDQYK